MNMDQNQEPYQNQPYPPNNTYGQLPDQGLGQASGWNQPPGYGQIYPGRPQNTQGGDAFAIASMVIGILSIVLCCVYGGVLGGVGLVLGIVSCVRNETRRGMAIAGITLSVLGVVLFIVLSIWSTQFRFGRLSQEERTEYIAEYLEDKYGIRYQVPRDVNRSNVGRMYIATAMTSVEDWAQSFTVWVSEDGEITDDRYVVEYREEIDALMGEIVKKYYPQCEVKTITRIEECPEGEWGSPGDARAMLEAEAAYTNILIFVTEQDLMTEESLDALVGELDFCDGQVRVFAVQDIYGVGLWDVSWSDATYHVEFKKKS